MGSGASNQAQSPANGNLALKAPPGGQNDLPDKAPPATDCRLPFVQYRDLFTLKNFWKTVQRNKETCSKEMLHKFLMDNSEFHEKYSKLKNVRISNASYKEDTDFENVAFNYFEIFDSVIGEVESNPTNAEGAIMKLSAVGKRHKKISGINSGSFQAMEEPFLYMVQNILQDRYNEKCEMLFRKLFQFCLKYIIEGYNE